MKILVVAATQMEIEASINERNNVEILICGVGIPATVYHLTKKLLEENYDMVIQAGIAGSFSKKIKLAEVVTIAQDAFGDIGIEEKKGFKTIFDLGFDDADKMPFSKGWLINNAEMLQTANLKQVKAVTINKISDRKRQSKQLKKYFGADIESMEGAAFHYVCLQQNIPFLQIRSISNKVGERDKAKWKIKEAIQNLKKELIRLLDQLNNK